MNGPMNIGLDYDGTYTTDPVAFDKVIRTFILAGFNVYLVTMRAPPPHFESVLVLEDLENKVTGMYFTDRKAKRPFMLAKGIKIAFWIEDMPEWLLTDARPRSEE
jgi:hypothetical protein